MSYMIECRLNGVGAYLKANLGQEVEAARGFGNTLSERLPVSFDSALALIIEVIIDVAAVRCQCLATGLESGLE